MFTSPDGAQIKVSLAANPSHLEAVDPVLEGIVRAKQDLLDKGEAGFTVLPVLMHGDAAFAGQGVVAETLNLSQLRGYRTGGTVHVVVNNQVGFTTSPAASRSSLYSHRRRPDDPGADLPRERRRPRGVRARGASWPFEFRQEFNKDVVIDMVCYRRRGHNEADDPSFTQPLMYDIIDSKRSVRKLYTEALIGRGDITVEEAEEALRDYQEQLERVFAETRDATGQAPRRAAGHRPRRRRRSRVDHGDHRVETCQADRRRATSTLPDGFTVHPRLAAAAATGARAMASEGHDRLGHRRAARVRLAAARGAPVRLAGQDTPARHVRPAARRAHRPQHRRGVHAAAAPGRGPGASSTSTTRCCREFAAMGFEYGYSVARPDALVLWEAQFGDFANGAQTIIDEFISSGEAKWGQRSGVVAAAAARLRGPGAGPLLRRASSGSCSCAPRTT